MKLLKNKPVNARAGSNPIPSLQVMIFQDSKYTSVKLLF
jgi:hypothetical protein